MTIKQITVFLTSFLLTAASSAEQATLNGDQDSGAQLRLIGDQTRVSVGLDSEDNFVGEFLGVFADDEDSAWIGEAWVSDSAGGLKLNYHRLFGSQSAHPTVAKGFLAVDRNQFSDRKVSAGAGMESELGFSSVHFSKSLSGSRLVGSQTLSIDDSVFGVDDQGEFLQDRNTTTITDFFQHPYEHGVGVRMGHFFEQGLFRLQAGLDHERGSFDSRQSTFSVTADKYISGTGHSFSLNAEFLRKSGDFEIASSDTRGSLVYRYDFGQTYRPAYTTKIHDVTVHLPAKAARTETRLVKKQVDIKSDAFFIIDRHSLTEDAKAALAQVREQIPVADLVGKIRIAGYACDIGKTDYNQKLSENRAAAVATYLLTSGLNESQLIVEGMGETHPIVPNTSEQNRRLNRRVIISYLAMQPAQVDTVVEPAVAAHDLIETRTEQVKSPPAWLDRALRNPAQHKRQVDYYNYQNSDTTVSLGDKNYLNNEPVAVNDVVDLQRVDGALVIDVLANDSDADADELTIVSTTSAAHGQVENFSSHVVYTPDPLYQGPDSFDYTIDDGQQGQSTATVMINILNQAPLAVADVAQTTRAAPVTIDVLANDSDPEGDSLTLVDADSTGNASVTIVNNKLVYLPQATFIGVESLEYKIADSLGAQSSATVTVTVTNLAPVAADDSLEIEEDSSVTIPVLDNDVPGSGDSLSITSVTTPTLGTANIVNGDTIQYSPNSNAFGSDSFSYTITDQFGESATANVVITINEVNDLPVAGDDDASTRKNTAVVIDVLANDTDVDNDMLSVTEIHQPANKMGSVTINPDGTLTYDPMPGWWGGDSFDYTVSDGRGGNVMATVTLTVFQ